MAITAASLVATVSMEGATAAQEQLAQLGSSASQAQSRLNQMQQGEGEASTSLGGRFVGAIKGGVSGLLNFGSQVGMTVMGFKGLYDGAVGLASGLLSSNASMEQTRVAFTTLLGSSKAAGDYLQQLQAFAASTPFEFPEVATAAQHMIAFGFSAKDVLPALTDIGDAMSAMGKGSADVDHIVEIFGQMKAAGKVTAQDMMQMASEGIPAWKYLAEAMGKTVPEVQKLSSQGLIPADNAIKDIEAGMHKAFGGGMQAQAMTFNGLLSTFKDNIGMAWRAFTGPLFEAAKNGLVVLGNLVSSKAFQDFATTTGKQIAAVFGQIGQFISDHIIPAFERLQPVVAAVIRYLNSDEFAGVIADFETLSIQVALFLNRMFSLVPIASLFNTVLSFLGPLLTRTIIPAIDSVVFGLGLFMQAVNEVTGAFKFLDPPIRKVSEAVQPLRDSIDATIRTFNQAHQAAQPLRDSIDAVTLTFNNAKKSVQPLRDSIDAVTYSFNQAHNTLTDTKNAINPVTDAFNKLKPVVNEIGTFLKETFLPVWKQIADTFKTQVKPAVDDLVRALKPLTPELQMLAEVIGTGLVGILIILVASLVGVTKAFAVAAAGIAIAVGGIVQVVSGMVQVVAGVLALLVDIVTGRFNKLGADLNVIWGGIARMFAGIWNTMRGTVMSSVGAIVALIEGFVGTITRLFQGLSNTLVGHSIIPDMMNAIMGWFARLPSMVMGSVIGLVNSVVGAFASLPGRAVGAVQSLGGMLAGTFANIAGQASAWGANIINGFVGGIRSMAGAAAQAAANVVGSVQDYLGFHSPAKKGEGRFIVEWGQGMIEGFNQGVMRAIPQLQTTVNMAVTAGAGPMRPAATVPAPFLAQSRQPAPQITVQAPSIYIDGKLLTNNLMPHIASAIRYGTGVR